jgi:mono/diheme cytochrome c family protein
LAPKTAGQLEIRVDLRGKRGLLSKIVSVDSTAGLSLLTVNVNIPEPDPRELNRMMALADRQAVFRNDCATCHAHPAIGKTGEPLYKAACGVCHEAEHRASMVPDLKALTMTKPTDKSYWDNWVRLGRPGTLMPAFTKAAGGPLDDAQIQSLVTFLSDHFRPAKSSDFGDPFGAASGSSF